MKRVLRNRPLDRLMTLADQPGWSQIRLTDAQLREIQRSPELPALLQAIRTSAANLRDIRLRLTALQPTNAPRLCRCCGEDVVGRADKVFCSDRCRQVVHRTTKT